MPLRGTRGGDPATEVYQKAISSEVKGDEVHVTRNVAVLRYYKGVLIHGDLSDPVRMPLLEDASLTDHQQEIYTLLKNGTFDRYIPIYVNTYKSNGDGTYYWVSTSVEVTRGPIPVDMVRRLVFPGTLLKQVPGGAYEGPETPINVSNMKPVILDRTWESILFDTLIDRAFITLPETWCEKPLPEDNPNAPRIPFETVKKTYESLFGPGTFPAEALETVFDGGSRHLYYDAAAKEYVFIYYSGAGGDPAEEEKGVRLKPNRFKMK